MTRTRYSLSAIVLHWAIALALAFQIGMGWQMEHLPEGPLMFAMFQLHKSVGIAILLLSVLRLALRLSLPRPAPMHDDPLKMRLAAWVHAGLYVFMIGAPLSGWLLVSTSKIKVPTLLFGTVPWPDIPVPAALRESVAAVADGAHGLLAWIGIALFLLHVAGAFRHEWLLKQETLGRMLPRALAPASRRLGVGAIATLTLIVAAALMLGQTYRLPAPAQAQANARSAPVPAPAAQAASRPVADIPERAAETEAPLNETAPEDAAEPEPRPVPWTVDPGGTLGFRADWNGNAIDGRFHRWSADIRFNPQALPDSSISVRIDLASADTADSQRDGMLVGEDFFDASRYATARYRSSRIIHLEGDRYEARGKLTLKGVTRDVPLRFTLHIRDGKATVSGTASLDRTAFGVGTGQWSSTSEIGGTVAMAFDFTANAGPR